MIKIHSFTHAFFLSAHPFSSSSVQASILSASKKHSDHVRIWNTGQVDGLLHHRGEHHGAPGSGVLGPRNRPPASGRGVDCPHPGAQREGGIHPPLHPRVRIYPPPLRPWTHVLLRVGSRVPAKPSRFEHWGAHEDLPLPTHALNLATISKSSLTNSQHKRHKIYIGLGHRCGVIPYSCVVCWIASRADDEQYKGKNSLLR